MPTNAAGGYHGYWQTDAYTPNPRFGSASDLTALSTALHNRGMFLMLDVVLNHFGPGMQSSSHNPSVTFHPQCNIDYSSQTSIEQCWVGGNLPDVDTENSNNLNLMNSWVKSTVSKYAIDFIRVDTVKHVRQAAWPGFLSAAGVAATGEVLSGDVNYVASYINNAGFPSLQNYPEYYPIVQSILQGGSMNNLATLISSQFGKYDASAQLIFADNQDQRRIRTQTGDAQRAANALVFVCMAEGIPSVYYGAEQDLQGGDDPANRAPLWTTGFPTTGATYQLIKKALSARTTAGTAMYMNIYSDANSYAFKRGSALVVVNNYGSSTSTSKTFSIQSQFSNGQVLTDVYSGQKVTVSGGSVTVQIRNGAPLILM